MRKMSMFAAVVLLACVATASAGTINLFFSTGDTTQDPNLRGNLDQYPVPATGNPTLYVSVNSSPAQQPYSVGSMHVYGDAACQGDGVGNEQIASLGLNVGAVLTSGAISGGLSASAFTVHTTAANTGAASDPWSVPSPNTPTLGAAPALVDNSRAVQVPSSTAVNEWNNYSPNIAGTGGCGGGLFAVNWPFTAGFNHYRMASMTVSASGFTGCPDPNNPVAGDPSCQASYDVKMAVGTLKITRVYDPTATVGPSPEQVSFGYAGLVPDTTLNPGNVAGGNAGAVDGSIVVSKIGDVGGFDDTFTWNFGRLDGVIDINDALFVFDNQGPITAGTVPGDLQPNRTRWAGDAGGFDENFSWLNVNAVNGDKRDGICDVNDALFIFDNMQGS